MRTADLPRNLTPQPSFELRHFFDFANALLVDQIKKVKVLNQTSRILEIGSFLIGREERPIFQNCDTTQAVVSPFSDIPHNAQHSLICDESHLPFSAAFDVVISSLYLHLAQDPKAALQQMLAVLKPGGRLFLSHLGHHSFFEWRSLFCEEGIPCGLIDFINPGLLETWLPRDGTRQLQEHWITISFPSLENFLHQLKALKLGNPSPGYTPLPFKTFKKLCTAFNEEPSQKLSFQLLCLAYHKPTITRDE